MAMVTTTMSKNLHEMQVFSQLSGGCHLVSVGTDQYACIGGIVLPYSIAVVVMLWVMTGNCSYEPILCESAQLSDVLKLNTHNIELIKKTDPYGMVHFLHSKIETVMANWSEIEFERLLGSLSGFFAK
jgi:hypothetical protein